MVTANGKDDNVSVLWGDGSGGFRTTVAYPVGNFPNSVMLGDVDGDGITDIVTANAGTSPDYEG